MLNLQQDGSLQKTQFYKERLEKKLNQNRKAKTTLITKETVPKPEDLDETKQSFVDFKFLKKLAADDDLERTLENEVQSPGSEITVKVEL